MDLSTISQEGEVWKPVKNFEGFYEVSNFGRIKSLERLYTIRSDRRRGGYYKTLPERILTSGTRKKSLNKGYYRVVCMTGGSRDKKRTVAVHILVAEHFLGERPDGYVIDHIDENTLNNRADNLHYVSKRVNYRKTALRYFGKLWESGETGVEKDMCCITCGRKY